MNAVEMMLIGQMDMPEFIVLLKSDSDLQKQLVELIPEAAMNNRDHPFWKHISYDSLKEYNYDPYRLLLARRRFDGTIADNLNIFGTIRAMHCYHYPETKYTKKYSAAFDLYLDVIKDCFDGPEVQHIVERIITEVLPLKSKSQRIKQARQEIALHFHVVDKQIPRWIQGPEWPMGLYSPMAYIARKRHGEAVSYTFKDVDTNEIRVIEQMY